MGPTPETLARLVPDWRHRLSPDEQRALLAIRRAYQAMTRRARLAERREAGHAAAIESPAEIQRERRYRAWRMDCRRARLPDRAIDLILDDLAEASLILPALDCIRAALALYLSPPSRAL